MSGPLLDLADQLATVRNLLMAAFMAAQDLGEPDKRGALVTLLHLTAEKLREAETTLVRIRGQPFNSGRPDVTALLASLTGVAPIR